MSSVKGASRFYVIGLSSRSFKDEFQEMSVLNLVITYNIYYVFIFYIRHAGKSDGVGLNQVFISGVVAC